MSNLKSTQITDLLMEVIGPTVNVRLYSYKSRRHYGGRDITTTAHTCPAVFKFKQRDGTLVVELAAECTGFKKGHVIAVLPKDFNI